VPQVAQEKPLEELDATNAPESDPEPPAEPTPAAQPPPAPAESQTGPELVEGVVDKLDAILSEIRALTDELKDPE
jgi:hypothetical protein